MSLIEAVHRLDLFALQLFEACQAVATSGRLSRQTLDDAVGDAASKAQVSQGLTRLEAMALLWPAGRTLHLPDQLSQAMPSRPLGLGGPLRAALARSDGATVKAMTTRLGLGSVPTKAAAVEALTAHHTDPSTLRQALDSAPPEARSLLARLDAGTGRMADPGSGYYGPRRTSAVPAVKWLVQRAFLVSADWTTLEVPREVTISLRGGRLVRGLDPERSPLAATEPPPAVAVDRAAGEAAVRLLDTTTALAEIVDASPLARLKDGGVGVRELRRLGAALDRDEAAVTGLLTLLGATGLLDPGERIMLDAGFDDWLAEPAAHRWSALVRACLKLGQPLSLTKPDGKLIPALVPVSLHPPIPLQALKRALLADHDGVAPAVDDLVRRARWHSPPMLADAAEELVPDLVREAELLGLLAAGTLSDAGRGLLTARPAADLGVARWFPTAVQDLLLQADLTAVVPGQPDPHLSPYCAVLAWTPKHVPHSSTACCSTAGTPLVMTTVQFVLEVCPSEAYMPSRSARASSRTSGTCTDF